MDKIHKPRKPKAERKNASGTKTTEVPKVEERKQSELTPEEEAILLKMLEDEDEDKENFSDNSKEKTSTHEKVETDNTSK